jgi:hypothetical protein
MLERISSLGVGIGATCISLAGAFVAHDKPAKTNAILRPMRRPEGSGFHFNRPVIGITLNPNATIITLASTSSIDKHMFSGRVANHSLGFSVPNHDGRCPIAE